MSTNGQLFGVGLGERGPIWAKIVVQWLQNPSSLPGNGAETTSTPSPCTTERNPGYEDTLLTLLNQTRAENGLPALVRDARLDQAALTHSQDMACNDFVDHRGSDGSTWFDRVRAVGIDDSQARENIYVGNPAYGGDAQGAFSWWMNSPPHKANILNTTATAVGIGYVYNANSTYGGYYTMVFASP